MGLQTTGLTAAAYSFTASGINAKRNSSAEASTSQIGPSSKRVSRKMEPPIGRAATAEHLQSSEVSSLVAKRYARTASGVTINRRVLSDVAARASVPGTVVSCRKA